MGRMSHYTWTLTADELDTIWWAVVERKERLTASAEKAKDPELRELDKRLAHKCYDLQCQINKMRHRCY